jgi:hypothetical protein
VARWGKTVYPHLELVTAIARSKYLNKLILNSKAKKVTKEKSDTQAQ